MPVFPTKHCIDQHGILGTTLSSSSCCTGAVYFGCRLLSSLDVVCAFSWPIHLHQRPLDLFLGNKGQIGCTCRNLQANEISRPYPGLSCNFSKNHGGGVCFRSIYFGNSPSGRLCTTLRSAFRGLDYGCSV